MGPWLGTLVMHFVPIIDMWFFHMQWKIIVESGCKISHFIALVWKQDMQPDSNSHYENVNDKCKLWDQCAVWIQTTGPDSIKSIFDLLSLCLHTAEHYHWKLCLAKAQIYRSEAQFEHRSWNLISVIDMQSLHTVDVYCGKCCWA